ncbi:TPA: hypothetical protein ACH3X1_011005 [Trebouxia sp. C0004]
MTLTLQNRMLAHTVRDIAVSFPGSGSGFATKAARRREQQAQLLPFGKALKAFLERVTSLNAHPDKAAAEVNTNSTHKVLQFVKALAQATNTYPPAMAENIVFVLRDPQTGKPRTVRTLLRTTGGDCSQAVGKSMASLFAGAGSPSLFYWDHGMWQLSNKAADEAVVQDARAKAAAAGVPSSEPMTLEELEAVQAKMAAKKQHGVPTTPNDFLNEAAPFTDAAFRDVASTASDIDVVRQADGDGASSSHATAADARRASQDLQEVPAESSEADGNILAEDEAEGNADLAAVKAQIQKLEPLLAALAAVPWIDPGAEDGQRVPYIKTAVLDEVEGMGWDIRGGVTRLWAGERDLTDILASKDPGSKIALETVIRLAKLFEEDFGKKTVSA